MGKSGHLRCIELEGYKLIQVHSKCLEWFSKAGWDAFYFEFKGPEYGVAPAFIERFNNIIARVVLLTLQVSEELIAMETKLQMDGE